MSLKEKILPYALHNAVSYGGRANAGSILGKILGENPGLRAKIAEVKKTIELAVKEINKLSLEEQKRRLEKTGFKEAEKEKEKGLPPLAGAKQGNVVMRIAPNPNGPLHIGHSRMILLNDEYVKKYKGTLILRFDDTDPKNENKVPMKEAYDMIQEDLKWLGVHYDRVERASARLEVYYSYFEKILGAGHAYICTCEQEKWSELVRVSGGQCPCRDNPVKENLEKWGKMLSWNFKEGHAAGRIKTSLEEKDPAMKDWVAFRIVDDPQHPLVGKNVKVWPTLDFASAIDDFEFGVTHIVRGKDLMISEKRQSALYGYMGWKYPETKVYGKFVAAEGLVLSKSKIHEGIKKGVYTGFDDPKLALLRAFRRRGILPGAIRNYIVSLGLSEAETTVDFEILFSENRKLVDLKADRYMVVIDPVEINISAPLEESGVASAKIKYHPDKNDFREVKISSRIFVSGKDFKNLNKKEVRLIDLFNVKLGKKSTYSKNQEFGFETKKIQWVSEENVNVKIVSPEGVWEGLGEKGLLKLKENTIIQMLRIGFGRVDSISNDQVTIYFAHK